MKDNRTLNEVVEHVLLHSSTPQTEDNVERVKQDFLKNTFSIGQLSTEPHPTQTIAEASVKLNPSSNFANSMINNYGLPSDVPRAVADFMRSAATEMSFSLATFDFNLDIAQSFGMSHDPSISFNDRNRYLGAAINAVGGGMVGGAVPAAINTYLSGPVENTLIWFTGIVATVGVGVFSAIKESTSTTQVSYRDRGELGVEKRVRSDVALSAEFRDLVPDNLGDVPISGKRESFHLLGKKYRKQFKAGDTHLGAAYSHMGSIPLYEHDFAEIFSSTIIDPSPGPTIITAQFEATFGGKKEGYKVAELYHHKRNPKEISSGVFQDTYEFKRVQRVEVPLSE